VLEYMFLFKKSSTAEVVSNAKYKGSSSKRAPTLHSQPPCNCNSLRAVVVYLRGRKTQVCIIADGGAGMSELEDACFESESQVRLLGNLTG